MILFISSLLFLVFSCLVSSSFCRDGSTGKQKLRERTEREVRKYEKDKKEDQDLVSRFAADFERDLRIFTVATVDS